MVPRIEDSTLIRSEERSETDALVFDVEMIGEGAEASVGTDGAEQRVCSLEGSEGWPGVVKQFAGGELFRVFLGRCPLLWA